MQNSVDHSPEDIEFNEHIFDIDFHPHRNLIAAGLITGGVEFHEYSEAKNVQLLQLKHHQDACRSVLFGETGHYLYTASSDCSVRCIDITGGVIWAELHAHKDPVNVLQNISPSLLGTGDDEGCVKLWDTRQRTSVAEWKEHSDYISDLTYHDHTLLATSGDGALSCYDLRTKKMIGHSDELEDELLSIAVVKNGRKVVCGSQDGVLCIFSWGQWGDMSNRFPGHPQSVETLVKIDEDTVCTGSSDGIIRIVQLHPNKLLGLVGDHEDFPVEMMKLSQDKKLIGSVSHSNKIHFWDVGYLHEEEEDEEEDEEEKGQAEVEDSDDDSDDGMAIDHGHTGRKAFPTAREQFFADL